MTTPPDSSVHPDVDVLVPTVNRPELLRETLQGIVAQDYPGVLRTLVHFDGTVPDQTLASDDPRRPIAVMGNPPGRAGLADARNTLITSTTAPVLAFCDDDDVWLPAKMTQQMALLARDPGAEVVGTGMIVEGSETTLTRVWDKDVVTLADLIRSRVQDLHPSSLVIRRGALDDIGLIDVDVPGSYGEDRDWMIRAARRTPIRMVAQPLVRVRWQQQSLFADKWDLIIEAIDYLVAKHPEFSDDKVGLARMVGRRAFALASLDRRREARHEARRALALSAKDKRAWAALVVGSGLISTDRAQRLANAAARGI